MSIEEIHVSHLRYWNGTILAILNWRSGVRYAMRAASQLSGRGPTDVDVAPVPAR